MKLLTVVYNGWGERWPLGTLADNGHGILFEYAPEALRRGLELSPRHLPLRALAFDDFPRHQHRLPGPIADALPDGWGWQLMDRLARRQGMAPAGLSPLTRLAMIGEHGLGALSFEPAAAVPAIDAVPLAELARAARALAQGQDSALLGHLALLGCAPQGRHPKVLVALDDGQPWIIKFAGHDQHREICAIEHVYAELARHCGLAVAATRHFELDRRSAAVGARRFDREDGMRVPVHTLAGLLHADFRQPSLDYSIVLRATRLITRDERQVEQAFRRCVFNVLFHHRRDHARNFAYRLGRYGDWQLSPCYGLSFGSGPHQTPVMGEALAPARSDLLRLAADVALPERRARDCIDALAAQAGLLAQLARQAPIRAATVRAIARTVAANRDRLL